MSRNSLWKMIQAMSLNADNKLWLGEKLIEEARKEVAETAPCQYSVEELEHRLGESVQRTAQEASRMRIVWTKEAQEDLENTECLKDS